MYKLIKRVYQLTSWDFCRAYLRNFVWIVFFNVAEINLFEAPSIGHKRTELALFSPFELAADPWFVANPLSTHLQDNLYN